MRPTSLTNEHDQEQYLAGTTIIESMDAMDLRHSVSMYELAVSICAPARGSFRG